MALSICHINLARGFRGGERQTELLVRDLAGRGVRQRVVVRKGDELGRRISDVPGIEVRELAKPFILGMNLGRGFLMHCHDSQGAHVAHWGQLTAGTPYIMTRRVDNIPSSSPFTRRMYRKATAVVAISEAIRRILVQYEPALRPTVIPSAMAKLSADLPVAVALRARWQGKFLIGHVGALDNSQKGQIHLIRVARQLESSHPQLHFILLGDGKDEAWFRQEAAGLTNVSFEGFVRNLGDYLSIFDLFAFPSLHEGLGSVLLDAMSFGLPIVASAVDGIPEIVRNDENGLLVPPADEVALAAAIVHLHQDVSLRARMGISGRRIAADYSPEVMGKRYLDLYTSIVESGSYKS